MGHQERQQPHSHYESRTTVSTEITHYPLPLLTTIPTSTTTITITTTATTTISTTSHIPSHTSTTTGMY
jgi:hypothetical protein